MKTAKTLGFAGSVPECPKNYEFGRCAKCTYPVAQISISYLHGGNKIMSHSFMILKQ